MTAEHQKELSRRLGRLSGGPSTSDLHVHPVNNSRQNPGVDDHVSMVGSQQVKNYAGIGGALSNNADGKRQSSRKEWHTDIQWEHVPCDYSILRLEKNPPTGGGKSSTPPTAARQHTNSSNRRHAICLGLRAVRPRVRAVPEIPRDAKHHVLAGQVRRGGAQNGH